jgi:DNA repair exonuclease SbcCD ATPase subunit
MASVNDDYNSRLKDKERSIADIKSRMGENQAELQQKMNAYVGRMENRLKEYQKESSESKAKAQQLVREVSVSAALKHYEEKKENEKKLQELAAKMKKLEEDLKNSRLRTEELDALLISYRKAMRHYASIRGEGGHVVSVQRDGSLLVELSPTLEHEKSTRGLVIDKSGALIARIDITQRDGLKKARVVNRLKNVPISPFDIIIVQKK